MTTLDHKIDFAVVFSVQNANPNGDPLNGNRPRQNYDGYGEVSDVCIKRKLRNRLQDMGEAIFVQSDDRNNDGFKSLNDRAESVPELKKIKADKKGNADVFATIASNEWFDVRAFGQVFAFKGDSLSVGVRGPVSIHPAISLAPIDITSIQITKSVNSVTGDKKGSDTMGMKHRVDFGIYKFVGSINTQLAEKTGFTNEDAAKFKEALITLFENENMSWNEILNTIDYSKSTILKYMDILINRGIVDHYYNNYSISDNMLKLWLKHKKMMDGHYPR